MTDECTATAGTAPAVADRADSSALQAGTAKEARPRPSRSRLPALVMAGLFAVAVTVAVTYTLVAVPKTEVQNPTVVPATLAHSDGLSDTHAGYRLEPVTLPTERGEALPVAFRILGPNGSPAVGYATVQTVPLHLFVVREDLSAYQHLHPRAVGDQWQASVRVPDGGVYRIYAEFTPAELASAAHPIVLGTRFIITGNTTQEPLPTAAPSVTAGQFTVDRLDGAAPLKAGVATVLRFRILDGGKRTAALEPYLGSFGHMSAFDAPTQALIHLHPLGTEAPRDGTLAFNALFPNRGLHRLFLQFQVAGAVHLAAFTIVVS